ncbi:hypothetical protein AMS62_20945 [Bacillus sp. FJAT-18019]|nr:hypothetical protein AMS62_20945 [Bacillus sp. FJAT-18019]
MKNWKRRMFLSLMISAGLLVTAAPAMAAQQQTTVKDNDQTIKYTINTPIIDQGTTLVPLRMTLQRFITI